MIRKFIKKKQEDFFPKRYFWYKKIDNISFSKTMKFFLPCITVSYLLGAFIFNLPTSLNIVISLLLMIFLQMPKLLTFDAINRQHEKMDVAMMSWLNDKNKTEDEVHALFKMSLIYFLYKLKNKKISFNKDEFENFKNQLQSSDIIIDLVAFKSLICEENNSMTEYYESFETKQIEEIDLEIISEWEKLMKEKKKSLEEDMSSFLEIEKNLNEFLEKDDGINQSEKTDIFKLSKSLKIGL